MKIVQSSLEKTFRKYIYFRFQEFQVVDKQRGKKFETPIGEGIQVEQKYAWS